MTATGLEPKTSLANSNPVLLNGWLVVYELSDCGFEPRCSHLNFRFHACFEQGIPWQSSNYRVWTHSETCTWHDTNIQINSDVLYIPPRFLAFHILLIFALKQLKISEIYTLFQLIKLLIFCILTVNMVKLLSIQNKWNNHNWCQFSI